MIVIFGASTGIGRRLAARLISAQRDVRRVSRSADGDLEADLATGAGVQEAMRGADIVVSCAHSKFTDSLLNAMPSGVGKVVLTGSAWRYSRVPNPSADQVRAAEVSFLKSSRNGVMLHPTMIYGGEQENNVIRLLQAIRRLPVIPAPGGGHQIVQPIYIDDVVDCLVAAVDRNWQGAHVVPLAGPPLTWREMVGTCAAAIGCPKPIVSIPASPIVAALAIFNRIGLRRIDANIVRRFAEDVDIPLSRMIEALSVQPRNFETGIGQAVAGWMRDGVL